jgi:hypothetical protein
VPDTLVFHPLLGDPAELVVDQDEEFIGCATIVGQGATQQLGDTTRGCVVCLFLRVGHLMEV